ncbi:gtpase slip-gc, partial [Fusarium heterosporum]
ATKDLSDQTHGDAEFGQAHMRKLLGRLNHSQEVLNKGSRMLESSRAQAQESSQAQNDADGWLHIKAIAERNSVVKEQIQANYAARQKELNRGSETTHTLPIFLVSSDAFWHWKKTASPYKGYPSIEATGVPAVEKWLLEATLRKRERHLDDLLGKYHNLMNLMRIYSQEKGRDADFGITRSSVEDALTPIHQNAAADLTMQLSIVSAEMDLLDPLANREMAIERFVADATSVARNWSRKYPDDERSGKMASGAYAANMRRGGESYTSKCNDGPIHYCWNEVLTTQYLRFISREFDEDMNQKMRQIETQAVEAFKHGWQHYPDKIENAIRQKFPNLELSFNNLILMMSNVERMSTTKIRNVFERLSSNASQITEDATSYIGGQMRPIFDAGLEIVGTGSYAKRVAHNVSGVTRRGPTMGAGVQDESHAMLKERLNNAKIELNQVVREAIQSVKQQVSLLIDNLMDNCPADNALKVQKIELQRQIRVHLGEWEQAWQQQETGQGVTNPGPNPPQLEAVKGLDEIGDSDDDSEDNLDDPFEIFENDSME